MRKRVCKGWESVSSYLAAIQLALLAKRHLPNSQPRTASVSALYTFHHKLLVQFIGKTFVFTKHERVGEPILEMGAPEWKICFRQLHPFPISLYNVTYLQGKFRLRRTITPSATKT